MIGRIILATLAYFFLVGLAASEENLKVDDLQKVINQYMDSDEDLRAEAIDQLSLADDEEEFDDEEVVSQDDDEEAQRKFFTQLKGEMANDQSFSINSQADLNRREY